MSKKFHSIEFKMKGSSVITILGNEWCGIKWKVGSQSSPLMIICTPLILICIPIGLFIQQILPVYRHMHRNHKSGTNFDPNRGCSTTVLRLEGNIMFKIFLCYLKHIFGIDYPTLVKCPVSWFSNAWNILTWNTIRDLTCIRQWAMSLGES